MGWLFFAFGFLIGCLIGIIFVLVNQGTALIKDIGRFIYNISKPTNKEVAMLELNCTNEEKIQITLTPVTSTGQPAEIQAGSLLVVVQSGEGTTDPIDDLNFWVVSGDNPGDTAYLVSADADLGEGVITISDYITLHVAGALASNLGLTAGSPVPK